MAIRKSELYSSIWASCDELRGGMDASQYKDYVLFMLFMKYVSDKYGNSDDFAPPIIIPEGASFQDMAALKGNPGIGDKINTEVIQPLVDANAMLGRTDFPDFNDPNKLGEGDEKVKRLENLIAIFQNPALDFSGNRAENDDILGDAYEYLMRHFATQSGKSKGQFYTPSEVSRVIAKVIGISPENAIGATTAYDPTCGSGSLLLKVAFEAGKRITLEGQEQAAMQTLLTGQTRLPGFSGEWEVKRLGEIVGIRNLKVNTFGSDIAIFCIELEQIGQNSGQIEDHLDARERQSSKYVFKPSDVLFGRLRPYLRKYWLADREGVCFCIELEQIGQNSGQIEDHLDARERQSSKYVFKPSDVLFGRLRPYLRKYWLADREGVCSTEIWPLIPLGTALVPEYLFQVVQTDAFIEAANSSYGTHMPRCDWGALRLYEIPLPADPAEQTAIATVLSDMDAEIAALAAQTDKTRLLKQAMMQELLTGRIRLPMPKKTEKELARA